MRPLQYRFMPPAGQIQRSRRRTADRALPRFGKRPSKLLRELDPMTAPVLLWLRDDLRLDDQPALAAAAGRPLLAVYVFDEESPGLRALGGASRWWLAHSLESLAASFSAAGGRLDIVRGRSQPTILRLAEAAGAGLVCWTRRYGAAEIAIDKSVKAALTARGVEARSFNGLLLREPWEVATDAGGAFRVFSAFWRRSRGLGALPAPTPAPKRLHAAPWPEGAPERATIAALGLAPRKPDWSGGLAESWRPGEPGAMARFEAFVGGALGDYPNARDLPAGATTSRLSPHLRFGEISVRRIASVIENAPASKTAPIRSQEKFLAELGWREFSYSLLYAFPDLAIRNWQEKFDAFPFLEDKQGFVAWTRGRTGYPIVDAGMRELWRTGFMHNRVRMVAASFVVKHLLCDWRRGEQWFWDTLCDADPANNPASWQWVAGSGADAAPYFRIFNPVLQGQKFDAGGEYVRRWIPELARLENAHIHAPWHAPNEALKNAGVTLGETYPHPIVDHQFARKRALAALAATKS
jgi:deoxyribodipyrimidine photo-lyase